MAYTNLKIEQMRKEITSKEIARFLGITEKTYGKKINEKGNSDFSLKQSMRIHKKYFPDVNRDYLFQSDSEPTAKNIAG